MLAMCGISEAGWFTGASKVAEQHDLIREWCEEHIWCCPAIGVDLHAPLHAPDLTERLIGESRRFLGSELRRGILDSAT
jgi:hypothetical protein